MVILLFCVLAGWMAILLQATLPRFELFLFQPPQLLVLVLVYAALRLKDARTFIVVCVLGFSLDLMSSNNRLGISVIPLAVVASIVLSQAEATISRRWWFQMILVVVSTFVYMTLTYLFYLIQLWAATRAAISALPETSMRTHDLPFHWHWPIVVWQAIIAGSLANALIAPFLYLGFNKFMGLLGQRIGKPKPLQTDVQYILR